MQFRPCIDLHQGRVKQIVGGTLTDDSGSLETNFEAEKPADWYASLYRKDGLTGGHMIQLGPGNKAAALAALTAWPGGLQIGGGVTIDSAGDWIDAGAEAVIVTSWVFYNGSVNEDRIKALSQSIGARRLVLDLSCRRKGDDYYVVTDRWQNFTKIRIEPRLLDRLSRYCAEYLVHGVDVEGRCQGIEAPLVGLLGEWGRIPVTYAGGIHNQADIDAISQLGRGRIDFTVGSALDIFGGKGFRYGDLARRYGPAPARANE